MTTNQIGDLCNWQLTQNKWAYMDAGQWAASQGRW
jgi:hypothetical protein